ncbi:FGGY-family carbohydrate kinase [Staphylococcus succinus]|uniref:xylulokinase n=1 Tax=Staphylococcus succinus TaxID=61015 RepID=UPI00062BB9BC|nr:FGGY-family carbohydrate kinase [Staphylococcus succinus]MEB8123688.1 FGGY-family carbohydrate kinase [Staphylococcus succinus]PNZ21674.1 ATPase [Staphylococcus succinus subsp. succinus]
MQRATQLKDSSGISIGIEFGSTRIKTVAIDEQFNTLASGYYEWENQFTNGYWTYSVNDIWIGIQKSYKDMATTFQTQYGLTLKTINSIGISGMMHGYLAFNEYEDLLVPFRTWRNSYTTEAAQKLREVFKYNIPERWSVAHLYQAILNKETHVSSVNYITTLSGYIHWYLTGEKVLGIGDASGMFPVDVQNQSYRKDLLAKADQLLQAHGFNKSMCDMLPSIKSAGEVAGYLTKEGAQLLDPEGNLEPGCIMCPPEGDAGTGMVATNAITPQSGNISAGTSAFAMIVLDHSLQKVYPEVDIVATPSSSEVAMIHSNNCTSEINAWMNLFEELFKTMGVNFSQDDLYGQILKASEKSDDDLGGLLSYGYVSGENITNVEVGYPLFIREPNHNFTIANFMKMQLFSAFSTLKIGMDLLKNNENITINKLIAHGGIFKTEGIAQSVLAAAMDAPITVMKHASEGGAWGISVLAQFATLKHKTTLEAFLSERVFATADETTLTPQKKDVDNFNHYIEKTIKALPIEQSMNKYLEGE